MKDNFGKTREEFLAWLEKQPDDPPGCVGCGAMAGCCASYPNCPGNPQWKPEQVPTKAECG